MPHRVQSPADHTQAPANHGTPQAGAPFSFDRRLASVRLRPYQEEAVAELLEAVRQPGRYQVVIGTAGGKTWIGTELAARMVREGRRVLWLSKDWELVGQAASTLCRRHEEGRLFAGLVGGSGSGILLGQSRSARVVFTTVHTLSRRGGLGAFDLVIIDESHWGEGGRLYAPVVATFPTIVGLTATPREWTGFTRVGQEYDFTYLVREGYAARPEVLEAMETGVSWSPTLVGTEGDFAPRSLAALGADDRRNALVVATYVQGQARFGQCLVFACDIRHATRLAEMFQRAGVPAEAVCHEMRLCERTEVISRFRAGRTRVLVNVAMLTHGVDIPEIRTVFLARPTASPTLFTQMIGRGARRIPGEKDWFFLVDFVDSIHLHGELAIRAARQPEVQAFMPPDQERLRLPRAVLLDRHQFMPAQIRRFPRVPGFECLEGLEYNPGQTFGIEFEVTHSVLRASASAEEWEAVALSLLEALRDKLGPTRVAAWPVRGYHGAKDMRLWNVERDGSCGWEVTSSILRDEHGFAEVKLACDAFKEAADRHRLRVDQSTGTHVHFGWATGSELDPRLLHEVLRAAAYYEPAFLSLVAPSRFGNLYCNPIRPSLATIADPHLVRSWEAWARNHGRYQAVNISNLFGAKGTIEVRLHSGTLAASKILAWVSLWMRLFEAVGRGCRVPSDPGGFPGTLPLSAGPEGDLAALAGFAGAGPELLDRLLARRAYVTRRSWLRSPTHGGLALETIAAWDRRHPTGVMP